MATSLASAVLLLDIECVIVGRLPVINVGTGVIGLYPLVQTVDGRPNLPARLSQALGEDEPCVRVRVLGVKQPVGLVERPAEMLKESVDSLASLFAGVPPSSMLRRLRQKDLASLTRSGDPCVPVVGQRPGTEPVTV